MKILFVISSLRGGGAERVASTLCNYWVDNGHEVVLVTLDGTQSDFYKCDPRIKRYALNSYMSSKNVLQKIYANFLRFLKIARAMRIERPDVAVAFMDVSNVLTTLASIGTGIPVIISERSYPPYFHDNDLFDRIRKFVYQFSSAFVAQTKLIANWGHKFFSKKIAIIMNPISNRALYSGEPVARKNVILAMGRLHPDKGFDLLVDAYNLCYAEFPDWELHIVGHGPEHEKVVNKINTYNIQHKVKMLGEIANPAACYATAKIFVLSSRVEGFPNVLIEAMANGLAVTSFNCESGPADIITHEEDGILVPPMNIHALADAIRKLVHDEELRTRLGNAAVKVKNKYILENIAQEWLALFQETINRVAR